MGRVAVRSAAFSLSGSSLSALLVLLRSVVVARLLSPSEFGRFALVATVLGVLEVASQPGLETAALQQRRLTKATIETLWSALVMRSMVLTAVILLLAEPLGELFEAQESVRLLQAIAFVPLIRSFISASVLAEAHRVNLGPQFRLQVIGQLSETVVAITLCAVTRSAGALVFALLVGTAAEAAGSWRVRGFRPRFRLVGSELWPLLRFGRWAFASNVLGYLSRSCDDLAVGRFTGVRALGLYRVAYRLGNLPTTQLSHAVGQVVLPYLARLQDDQETGRRQTVYLRYLTLTSAAAGFVAVALAVSAHDLVAVLLGPSWVDAGPVLAVLSGAGFVRAVVASGGTFFMAGGRPELDTAMLALRLAVLVAGLALLLGTWGIVGAAFASLLSVLATVPFWLRGLGRFGYRSTELLRAMVRPLPAVVLAGLVSLGASALIRPPLPSLLVTGVVAASSWLILSALLHPQLRHELVLVTKYLRSSRMSAARRTRALADH